MLNIISLGAGVQSSTLALMAARGEVPGHPVPDAAIFADTQAEPKPVYDWLDWLEGQLPYPVYRVTAGNLESDGAIPRISKNGNSYFKAAIPLFTVHQDGTRGMLRRQCTVQYKIDPIYRKVKRLLGINRAVKEIRAQMWIGISFDELQRMKPNHTTYIQNIWPLVDMGMRRQDCIEWMARHGYPKPPRSACVFCPYHSDAEWLDLKNNHPDEFERAVAFEKRLAETRKAAPTLRGEIYLHRSTVPLGEVQFVDASTTNQLDLFGEECEGVCGV